jgi:hypothetical protein
LGADVTSVKCNGKWLHLGVMVDDIQGIVLTIDPLEAEDARTLKAWIAPVAEAVGAELLVTDDADALKPVPDELDMAHQVCTNHAWPEGCRRVRDNTEALAEELLAGLREDGDGSLPARVPSDGGSRSVTGRCGGASGWHRPLT